jgi:hypothetical protein
VTKRVVKGHAAVASWCGPGPADVASSGSGGKQRISYIVRKDGRHHLGDRGYTTKNKETNKGAKHARPLLIAGPVAQLSLFGLLVLYSRAVRKTGGPVSVWPCGQLRPAAELMRFD